MTLFPSRRESLQLATAFVDAAYYLKLYPDVAEAGFPPVKHYFEHGWRENRSPNPLFDPAFYVTQISHPLTVPALLHYLKVGSALGMKPHPLFDRVYYLGLYPDLADSGVDPLVHYLASGGKELRSPHPLFDAPFYAAQLPADAAGVNGLCHYLHTGWRRGLNPHPLFDTAFYLAQAEAHEVIKKPVLLHYLQHGAAAGRAPHRLFDPVFYREQAGPVVDPLQHFLREGAALGFNPHPRFDTCFYLEQNLDVAALGANPLVHFVVRGADEGRSPWRAMSGALLRTWPKTAGMPRWRALLGDFDLAAFALPNVLDWQFGVSADWVLKDLRLETGFDDAAGLRMAKLSPLIEEVLALSNTLPRRRKVDVSIVVPVHNKLAHTLGCLRSILLAGSNFRFEVIVADDASSDATPKVLADLRDSGIQTIRQATALGFLRNCNTAARQARGEWLVLLNNDTVVLPGWLDALVDTFRANPKAGLVGAKLINPDGVLQECGGFVWRSADAWNIGRGSDPRMPAFNFMRTVDYCSGAAIAVPTALWRELDGFDERFAPAYYEDTDLAFRIKDAGFQVVVQPLSCVVHFEGASHGKSVTTGIKKHQEINRKTFALSWKKALTKLPAAPSVVDFDALRVSKKTILVVDAEVPRPDQDSGSNDTFQYIRALLQFGYHVVFVAQNCLYLGRYTQDLQRMGVECLYAPFVCSLHQAVQTLQGRIAAVLVFRFNVAQDLLPALREHAPDAKVILETVDLHYLREARHAALSGDPADQARAEKTRLDELAVINAVDASIVLSEHEFQVLKEERPNANLHCIPILRELPEVDTSALEKRNTLLFVGGFRHPPNVDGIYWFVTKVWPHLVQKGFAGRLVIVGSEMPESVKRLATRKIKTLGFVEDLAPLYAKCRATIAPLRYGAGLKGKIISSLAYGLPCVSTSIGVEGSGLKHGKHVLVADEAEKMADEIVRLFEDDALWQRLSNNGLDYFRKKFSTEAVFPKIHSLLRKLGV